MSSSALKIAAVVFVLLAIVLAVVAFQMTRSYTQPPPVAPAEPASGAVSEVEQLPRAVVALVPLSAYQPITAEQVKLAPVAVQPEGHFGSVEDVVNRIPLIDIDAGAPLTGRYFKESNALARIVPDGHKAVSVEVNDVIAVGGFLRPGDTVDVLVYLRGGAGIESVQARRLLTEVRVLALEDRIIDRPASAEADNAQADQRRRQRTIVMAVPDDQVTRFMLGSSLGEIRLAMHGQVPEVADLDAFADNASSDADGGAMTTAQANDDSDSAADTGAATDAIASDTPVTAEQLSEVEAPKKKAAQSAPRHRIFVYRGAQVETVLD